MFKIVQSHIDVVKLMKTRAKEVRHKTRHVISLARFCPAAYIVEATPFKKRKTA
jgi:hypothetical protein